MRRERVDYLFLIGAFTFRHIAAARFNADGEYVTKPICGMRRTGYTDPVPLLTATAGHWPAISSFGIHPFVLRLYDHLSLRAFKLLLAISETRSLTKAAAQLHIVPSAASRRVVALEDALGLTLITRTSRGAELTPAGHAIAKRAQSIVRDIDQLDEELSDLVSGVRGHVRLSASASAIVQHLPEDLAHFLECYPDVRVDLYEDTSASIAEKLIRGETDVGILVADGAPDGLALMKSKREELAVVMPAGHRLSAFNSIGFRELIDEDWIALRPGTALATLLNTKARALGATLRMRIEVNGMDSACRMVQSGLGIALLPATALKPYERFPGLTSVQLTDDWAVRTIHVAIKSDSQLSTAAQALVDSLWSMPHSLVGDQDSR